MLFTIYGDHSSSPLCGQNRTSGRCGFCCDAITTDDDQTDFLLGCGRFEEWFNYRVLQYAGATARCRVSPRMCGALLCACARESFVRARAHSWDAFWWKRRDCIFVCLFTCIYLHGYYVLVSFVTKDEAAATRSVIYMYIYIKCVYTQNDMICPHNKPPFRRYTDYLAEMEWTQTEWRWRTVVKCGIGIKWNGDSFAIPFDITTYIYMCKFV